METKCVSDVLLWLSFCSFWGGNRTRCHKVINVHSVWLGHRRLPGNLLFLLNSSTLRSIAWPCHGNTIITLYPHVCSLTTDSLSWMYLLRHPKGVSRLNVSKSPRVISQVPRFLCHNFVRTAIHPVVHGRNTQAIFDSSHCQHPIYQQILSAVMNHKNPKSTHFSTSISCLAYGSSFLIGIPYSILPHIILSLHLNPK